MKLPYGVWFRSYTYFLSNKSNGKPLSTIFHPFHLPYDNMTPNIGVVMMLFKDNNIVKWTILCFHFNLSFDEFYILSNILMYDSYFCRYSIMYNQIIQNTILWCINSLQKSFKASFPNWALVVYHHKTSW